MSYMCHSPWQKSPLPWNFCVLTTTETNFFWLFFNGLWKLWTIVFWDWPNALLGTITPPLLSLKRIDAFGRINVLNDMPSFGKNSTIGTNNTSCEWWGWIVYFILISNHHIHHFCSLSLYSPFCSLLYSGGVPRDLDSPQPLTVSTLIATTAAFNPPPNETTQESAALLFPHDYYNSSGVLPDHEQIWDCAIIKLHEVNGKRFRSCEWCGKETPQVHSTKA